MKNYVIGIGGSGHRCIEALLHLAAAGLINGNELNLMYIDADSGNGNYVDKTKKLMEAYYGIGCHSDSSSSLFKTKIKPVENVDNCLWSPIEGILGNCSIEESKKNMNNIFKYLTMTEDEKVLFDFLFTDREKTRPLTEGFYGHPSIGSMMISHSLDFDSAPWTTLVNNLTQDAKNDEVRLFLFASIFGGTGAAGFPTISNFLKSKINNPNLKIGGYLLLPYFKFDSSRFNDAGTDATICPDSGNFMAKSKAALFFYDSQDFCERCFERIYLAGDSYEEFAEVMPSLGSSTQKNKAHYVELLGAFSAADYFNSNSVDGDKKVFVTSRSKKIGADKGGYIYQWDVLEGIAGDNLNVKELLAQQLRFSIAYTKHFFPMIKDIATSSANKNLNKSNTWYKNYFIDQGVEIRETGNQNFLYLSVVYEYCCRFIDWIYEIHVQEDSEGNRKINPQMHLFNVSNSGLFNKKYIESVEMEGFQDLVYGHAKSENGFSKIFNKMSIKGSKKNVNRSPVNQFICDLYQHSALN